VVFKSYFIVGVWLAWWPRIQDSGYSLRLVSGVAAFLRISSSLVFMSNSPDQTNFERVRDGGWPESRTFDKPHRYAAFVAKFPESVASEIRRKVLLDVAFTNAVLLDKPLAVDASESEVQKFKREAAAFSRVDSKEYVTLIFSERLPSVMITFEYSEMTTDINGTPYSRNGYSVVTRQNGEERYIAADLAEWFALYEVSPASFCGEMSALDVRLTRPDGTFLLPDEDWRDFSLVVEAINAATKRDGSFARFDTLARKCVSRKACDEAGRLFPAALAAAGAEAAPAIEYARAKGIFA
jgi:hypothetical protein